MEIIPAIDLTHGQAVRLTKGLMESAKVYSDKPQDLAKSFEAMGAKWLHIVDLDGAFAGEPKNFETIVRIREACGLKIELGGGIRNEETLKRYMEIGIDRLILGSVAMRDPSFVKKMAEKYKVAVGIDAKDGFVAVEGWAQAGKILAVELASHFKDIPLDAIICTDISRDGTLEGINESFTREIALASGHCTIASGGVASNEEVCALAKETLIGGVIIGKAFYEGRVDLITLYRDKQKILKYLF